MNGSFRKRSQWSYYYDATNYAIIMSTIKIGSGANFTHTFTTPQTLITTGFTDSIEQLLQHSTKRKWQLDFMNRVSANTTTNITMSFMLYRSAQFTNRNTPTWCGIPFDIPCHQNNFHMIHHHHPRPNEWSEGTHYTGYFVWFMQLLLHNNIVLHKFSKNGMSDDKCHFKQSSNVKNL